MASQRVHLGLVESFNLKHFAVSVLLAHCASQMMPARNGPSSEANNQDSFDKLFSYRHSAGYISASNKASASSKLVPAKSPQLDLTNI